MSVLEKDTVDGVGISTDTNNLILFLSDTLNFDNEIDHLVMLQNKLNSYIAYIDTKQYQEDYPDYLFNDIVVEITFKYKPTEKCLTFINNVNVIMKNYNMRCEIK